MLPGRTARPGELAGDHPHYEGRDAVAEGQGQRDLREHRCSLDGRELGKHQIPERLHRHVLDNEVVGIVLCIAACRPALDGPLSFQAASPIAFERLPNGIRREVEPFEPEQATEQGRPANADLVSVVA